jgi:hypothetical protein
MHGTIVIQRVPQEADDNYLVCKKAKRVGNKLQKPLKD